jgi:GNAT superfamily N-acetyltransferase
VRPVRPREVDDLLPAAVAMFTEEVGVSPLRVDGGAGYRAAVEDLVRAGSPWRGSSTAGPVQGRDRRGVPRRLPGPGRVDAPEWRGRGIGAAGMAAVVEYARTSIAPVVSLYVNDFNAPARAVYRRVGFREVALRQRAVLGAC